MKADCIIVIGARPATNHPVAATYFKQAVKPVHEGGRGAKMVVMDPARSGSDAPRIASRPLQTRHRRRHAERDDPHHHRGEALRRAVHSSERRGFRSLARKGRRFRARSDGRGLRRPRPTCCATWARTYAQAERSIIFWGMGISQHTHGTDNSRCLIALGAHHRPCRASRHRVAPRCADRTTCRGASDAGLIPMFFPDYKSVENPDVRGPMEDFWGRALDPVRGADRRRDHGRRP